MQSTKQSLMISAAAMMCFLFAGAHWRKAATDSRQADQERTLEVQLKELSSLASKSSGIEQNFEYHVSSDGSIIVVSNNPDGFIHVFGLTNSKAFFFEMRELKGVQYLADYQPSDAPAVRIPNPIKDTGRYALVALRTTVMGPKPLSDLTDLAPIAEQVRRPRVTTAPRISDRRHPLPSLSGPNTPVCPS